MNECIQQAVAALGEGPLQEDGDSTPHRAALFPRARERSVSTWPIIRSVGLSTRWPKTWPKQPLSGTAGSAMPGMRGSRSVRHFAPGSRRLIRAPRADCIVPKTSAGQGLRSVLNALPGKPRVISTRGEFDSVDVILKQYAALDRIDMRWIEPDAQGDFTVQPLIDAVQEGADLVVVSQVMFMTGQIVEGLTHLAEACHQHGARLLVDSYHAIGVIPVDVAQMRADFMIGGSYKYLRGGPGACFLYISPAAFWRAACARSIPDGSPTPTPLPISGPNSARAQVRRRRFSRIHAARVDLVSGAQRSGVHACDGCGAASRLQPQSTCRFTRIPCCRRHSRCDRGRRHARSISCDPSRERDGTAGKAGYAKASSAMRAGNGSGSAPIASLATKNCAAPLPR